MYLGSFLPHPRRRMPAVPQAHREEETGLCAATN